MRSLIVSYAKSGSTVLQYMLAAAQDTSVLYEEEPAKTLHGPADNCVAKIIFENEDEADLLAILPKFERKIFLLRDPRDNLVSRVLYSIGNFPQLLQDDSFLQRLLQLLHQKQSQPRSVDLLTLDQLFPSRLAAFSKARIARLQRYLQFIARQKQGWHVMYYEDLVQRNFLALNRYMGLAVRPVDVPPGMARVSRARTTGDWRHWLTENDVSLLRAGYTPLLHSMGYENEWQLAAQPQILPEHCQDYALRLIQERRRHYGFPPFSVIE